MQNLYTVTKVSYLISQVFDSDLWGLPLRIVDKQRLLSDKQLRLRYEKRWAGLDEARLKKYENYSHENTRSFLIA